MTWTSEYQFRDPLWDIRGIPELAEALHSELLRELSPGHPLYGTVVTVIAKANLQDAVVVETKTDVALVHSGRPVTSR